MPQLVQRRRRCDRLGPVYDADWQAAEGSGSGPLRPRGGSLLQLQLGEGAEARAQAPETVAALALGGARGGGGLGLLGLVGGRGRRGRGLGRGLGLLGLGALGAGLAIAAVALLLAAAPAVGRDELLLDDVPGLGGGDGGLLRGVGDDPLEGAARALLVLEPVAVVARVLAGLLVEGRDDLARLVGGHAVAVRLHAEPPTERLALLAVAHEALVVVRDREHRQAEAGAREVVFLVGAAAGVVGLPDGHGVVEVGGREPGDDAAGGALGLGDEGNAVGVTEGHGELLRA